jgi:hypothetical protein
MVLRRTSGSSVMSSLGPTRASDPTIAVSLDMSAMYERIAARRTIFVIDLLERDWLATFDGLPHHPPLGEGCDERAWHMCEATPLQHSAHKVGTQGNGDGANGQGRFVGGNHGSETRCGQRLCGTDPGRRLLRQDPGRGDGTPRVPRERPWARQAGRLATSAPCTLLPRPPADGSAPRTPTLLHMGFPH